MGDLEFPKDDYPIKFQQGNKPLCLPCAMANIFSYYKQHNVQAEKLSKMLFKQGVNLLSSVNPKPSLFKTVEVFFQENYSSLSVDVKKYENINVSYFLEVFVKTQLKETDVAIMRLRDVDDSALHVTGLFQGKIFDSNCTHAIKLSLHNLNMVAGTGCREIAELTKWSISKRGRKRKNLGRKRSKQQKRKRANHERI